MKRNASAVWNGGLKDGKGTMSTDSGVLADAQYSFSTRFEDGIGTNPEELIAAAHAGCFSMALSGQLGQAGLTAESIRTTASVSLEKTDNGFAITKVHLDVTAKVPGAGRRHGEQERSREQRPAPATQHLRRRQPTRRQVVQFPNFLRLRSRWQPGWSRKLYDRSCRSTQAS